VCENARKSGTDNTWVGLCVCELHSLVGATFIYAGVCVWECVRERDENKCLCVCELHLLVDANSWLARPHSQAAGVDVCVRERETERGRERERETEIRTYICMYIHIYIYG